MKLLHVTSGMNPALGGVSQAVRTIIKGLTITGVYNEVVSLDSPDASWNQTAPFVTHALGPSWGPWQYSSKLIPWLLKNLARFDAVILHGLWLYHGYALYRVLQRLPNATLNKAPRPKFFAMPHGMLDPYFQRTASRKVKALRNRIYWHFIEATIINNADGILFTCETERLLAREPFVPYHPQRELVVGLGVEEPSAYTAAMQEAFLAKCIELKDRPYLLFLSRIHEKKGVDLLLQAYAQLIHSIALMATPTRQQFREELPAPLLKVPALVIAGPGIETTYGQRIRKLAAELQESVGADIFFPGMLSGDAKWGAFYGCEAFILPSHQENFGIAIVEALACSKPALISNQVNIWREIEATGSGIVADDTLMGVRLLLEKWCSLTTLEKQSKARQARTTYHDYFAIEPTTKKISLALQKI
ncbi:glycosyltransferase [Hymenobacter sp. RP-2-7]|uniref:Glycosyltransferase n=1 Tax=Hymenobacter polaris TaxID=2682546 RepID=A0A7Y0FKF3_9BACT|nr:glycosyltransferase [Hymenobacter polaris]NML63643.1 glycosyltransferase [Hymenobacter polaris]